MTNATNYGDRLQQICRIQRYLLNQHEFSAFTLMQDLFQSILADAKQHYGQRYGRAS